MKFLRLQVLLLMVLLLFSCSRQYYVKEEHSLTTKIYPDSLKITDPSIDQMIAPYKQKLDAQMNEVIGYADEALKKEQPDGALGNMVADACLSYAIKNNEKAADFCVLNSGGIRIPGIQQGEITVGRIYELMPFDNMIEVIALDGAACKELFNWIIKWGGAPVSGLTFTIENNEAKNITINGSPFDENKTYLVATTDFIANGGDGAGMFKNPSYRAQLNYKLRDAILEYIRDKWANKTNLKADNDGRITIKP